MEGRRVKYARSSILPKHRFRFSFLLSLFILYFYSSLSLLYLHAIILLPFNHVARKLRQDPHGYVFCPPASVRHPSHLSSTGNSHPELANAVAER